MLGLVPAVWDMTGYRYCFRVAPGVSSSKKVSEGPSMVCIGLPVVADMSASMNKSFTLFRGSFLATMRCCLSIAAWVAFALWMLLLFLERFGFCFDVRLAPPFLLVLPVSFFLTSLV